jgi:hypothetical protein
MRQAESRTDAIAIWMLVCDQGDALGRVYQNHSLFDQDRVQLLV